MHLALADISIVTLFADRITSAQGLGGRFRPSSAYRPNVPRGAKIHGPLAEKPMRWGMSAFGGKADMAFRSANVCF